MSTQLTPEVRRPTVEAAILTGAVALVFASVATGAGGVAVPGLAAVMAVGVVVWRRTLEWTVLTGVILAAVLLLPVKRATLPIHLPIDLDPYRLVVACVALLWLAALLTDRRVRLRRTPFDAPLLLFALAVFLSIAVNPARIYKFAVQGEVVKALFFVVSLILIYYILTSVITSRERVHSVVKILVVLGGVVGALAIYEFYTSKNPFDLYLKDVLPFLHVTGGLTTAELGRAGALRVYGPMEHPIELSAVLAMLAPLSWYLWKSTGHRGWLVLGSVMVLGSLATVSRTGVIMFLVIAAVFVWLRPEVRQLWPLIVPALVVVFFALPHTLGSFYSAFFPQGGLVAQQQVTVEGNDLGADGRLADIGPSLAEFSRRPIFGEGFGTRITSRTERASGPPRNARLLDDQWLATLLEVGLFGSVTWAWLTLGAIRRLVHRAREDLGADGWLAVAFAASLAGLAVGMFTFDMMGFAQVTILNIVFLALTASLLGYGPDESSERRTLRRSSALSGPALSADRFRADV